MEKRIPKPENSPYVGPRPFEQKDSKLFYGRNYETLEIISLILSNPLTLIYSQSGVGKTSLFNTKIINELEKQYKFKTFPSARVRSVISPDKIPEDVTNMYIFNALLSLKADANVDIIKNQSLSDFLKQDESNEKKETSSMPRIIVFDQMEELFGLYPENWYNQQQDFFRQIAEALSQDKMLRIVFIIREEYLAYLSSFAQLLPSRLRARFRLERLRKDAALEAVLEPIKQKGEFVFAPGVAEKLVDDLLTMRVETIFGKIVDMKGEYVEPVHLQVVCQRLWMKAHLMGITEITQEHLKGSADVNQALTEFYLDIIDDTAKYTDVSRDKIRNWINQYLITSSGTRGIVHREEKSTGGLPNKVVDFLQERYLIRQELRSGSRWYELTHDRLIGPIRESNKEWKEKKKVKKLTVTTTLLASAIIGILVVYLTTAVPESVKPEQTLVFDQRIVPVGSAPGGVAVDRSTGLVYVTNLGSNALSVINGTTNKLLTNVAVGRGPSDVAIDPYTSRVYVANQENDSLSVINGTSDKVISNLRVGDQPYGVSVDPYSHMIYVTNHGDNTLSVVNGATNNLVTNVPVGRGPSDVAVDTYTNRVYVANQENASLSVINGTSNKVISNLRVGSQPYGVSVDPYSHLVYVTNNGKATISVINGTTNKLVTNVAVGRGPNGVSVDPISNMIYVANQGNGSLSVINGTSDKVISNLRVGSQPYGVSVDPYSNTIYVVNKLDETMSIIKSGNARTQVPFRVAYQGLLGSKIPGSENMFTNPAGLEYSSLNNRIYVADINNNRIQVFDINGSLIKTWGTKGNGTGQFDAPGDVAVDPVTGYVFVSDINNSRIQKFDSDGRFLKMWGSAGSANGQFNHPADIVIDTVKRVLYVVDDWNNRIQKFETNGKFLSKWGSTGSKNGEFRLPTGITMDGNGKIYVADTYNNRIQKFDENGHFISKWGSSGGGVLDFNRPDGLAYDTDSNLLYVSDRKNGRILVLTDEGKPFYDLVLPETTGGLHIKPRDVTLDKDGKLYVADKDNNRIHIFTTRTPSR